MKLILTGLHVRADVDALPVVAVGGPDDRQLVGVVDQRSLLGLPLRQSGQGLMRRSKFRCFCRRSGSGKYLPCLPKIMILAIEVLFWVTFNHF